MALQSINRLLPLRRVLVGCRNFWLEVRFGVEFGGFVNLSLSSRLLPHRRGSIKVGSDTLIAFKTLIYTFDPLEQKDKPVTIGCRCFVGGGSTILPGVTIGDECIIGAGAVVSEDIPSRCIVGGNPARVLRRNIKVGRLGRLEGADTAMVGRN